MRTIGRDRLTTSAVQPPRFLSWQPRSFKRTTDRRRLIRSLVRRPRAGRRTKSRTRLGSAAGVQTRWHQRFPTCSVIPNQKFTALCAKRQYLHRSHGACVATRASRAICACEMSAAVAAMCRCSPPTWSAPVARWWPMLGSGDARAVSQSSRNEAMEAEMGMRRSTRGLLRLCACARPDGVIMVVSSEPAKKADWNRLESAPDCYDRLVGGLHDAGMPVSRHRPRRDVRRSPNV